MDYSAKNNLKVFVSPYSTPSSQLTVDALLVNEIGFYDAQGDLAASGLGYFYWRKSNGKVQKSKLINFAGWSGIQSYAAPTLEVQRVTVPSATAGELYQLRVEMKLPFMEGEYIKHGNYKAVSGDSTTTIAAALVASINAAFAREGKSYFTIENTGAAIDITQLAQTYVKAKKQGLPISYKVGISHPQADAILGAVTTPGAPGIGSANYVAEYEMFAQGDHDSFRFNTWPNSFDWDSLEASKTGQYDVLALTEETPVQSAMDAVYAPQQYLLCFDTTVLSTETDIIDFVLAAQDAPAVVNATAHTVAIDVAIGTVVTALEPDVSVSPGATVSPLSGVATDFTGAVNYTVTAEDGVTTQVWAVTVTVLT